MRILFLLLLIELIGGCDSKQDHKTLKPNFIVILTDDQRYDAIGAYGKSPVITPNMDKLAQAGINYVNACVTLSICSPSRAAILSGRYGSKTGVTMLRESSLKENEILLPQILKNNGYRTGLVGKWHLNKQPDSCGFDYYTYFYANGPYYRRSVLEMGKEKQIDQYIEEYNVDQAMEFITNSINNGKPYFLFLCTQLPHMNQNLEWDVKKETEKLYENLEITVPTSWKDDLIKKPSYLIEARSRQQALKYGYADPDSLLQHKLKYYSSITELDSSLGRIINYLLNGPIQNDTYVMFIGDNGWFLGEHKFTSKVLAYEESIRVPFLICGPGIEHKNNQDLVLNIDIMPTILELAGLDIPSNIHGLNLSNTFNRELTDLREFIFYEAPDSQLGSYPLYAARSENWKYIQTYDNVNKEVLIFEELYDLKNDPFEMKNLSEDRNYDKIKNEISEWLEQYKTALSKEG